MWMYMNLQFAVYLNVRDVATHTATQCCNTICNTMLQHTLQHNVVAVCVKMGMLDWICNALRIANSIEHPHCDTHCNNIVLQCVLQQHEYSSTSQIQVNSIEHPHFDTHCNNIVLQCVLQHHEYSSTSQIQVNSIEHPHLDTHCNNIALQCVLQHHAMRIEWWCQNPISKQ